MGEWLGKIRAARGLPLLIALAVAAGVLMYVMDSLPGGTAGETVLEGRMARVLGQIEGAGKVTVMIHEADDEVQNADQTAKEAGIVGVVVVAQGANDVKVKIEIREAVMTLLDVDAENVLVLAPDGG